MNIVPANPQIAVNTIIQDSLGYIWFGTSDGLLKFDGVSISQYNVDQGLPTNNITAVFSDNQKLYLGFSSGEVCVFYPKSAENKLISKLKISDKINDILYFDNQLYIGTNGGGLYILKKDSVYNYNSFEKLNDDYVHTIAAFNQKIWIGTDIGIAIYNPEKEDFKYITQTDGLPDNIIKKFIVKNDTLWIGMENGYLGYFLLNNTSFYHSLQHPQITINSFLISKQKTWLATQNVSLIYIENNANQGILTKIGASKGISGESIRQIMEDREGNIWIAPEKGLHYLNKDYFTFINSTDNLPFNNIVSLTEDNLGRKWFSSPEGLFVLWKENLGQWAYKQLFKEEKHKNTVFTSLFADNSGYIWAGTFGFGLYKINAKTLDYIQFTDKNGLTDNSILHLSGKDNYLWISTAGGGAIKLNTADSSDIHVFNERNGFSNYVYATFTDSRNNVWIAQDGKGLIKLGKGIFSINEYFSIDEKTVYSISEDMLGGIWFSTPKNGVYRIFGDSIHHYTKLNGLSSNEIVSIYASKSKPYVVFVSNNGIDVLSLTQSSFKFFGNSYNVAYLQPNLNAIGLIDENIWIGTNNGIISANSGIFEINIAPTLFIEQIKLHGEIFEQQSPVLNYKNNHFEFKFNGIWLQSPSSLIFRHKLQNFDNDWINSGLARSVVYSNIPPGNYSFEVQVSFNGINWISSPLANYSFIIKAPFWQNPFFIASALVFLILSVIIGIRLRTRALINAKNLLELEVKRRTEEIEKQKEELKTQKDQIEEINKNLTDSIIYARRIQLAVLTPFNQIDNILKDYFIFFQPRDIVSGDFYYIARHHDWRIIVAADCTGHGVPGALMSMLGITFLNEILSKTNFDEFSAANVLNELREKIKQSLRQTGKSGESQDGMDMSFIAANIATKKIQFAGANLPIILIRNNEIIVRKPDKMPIGIYRSENQQFTYDEDDLLENDIYYLFSDGYQDQFGGKSNRKFLFKSLKEMFFDIHNLPMENQKQRVEENLAKWMQDKFQVDDILVMSWKFSEIIDE